MVGPCARSSVAVGHCRRLCHGLFGASVTAHHHSDITVVSQRYTGLVGRGGLGVMFGGDSGIRSPAVRGLADVAIVIAIIIYRDWIVRRDSDLFADTTPPSDESRVLGRGHRQF